MQNQSAATAAVQPNPLRAYSPEQFAAMISWHPESVRLGCRKGRIKAVKFGKDWRISHATAVEVIANGIPRMGE